MLLWSSPNTVHKAGYLHMALEMCSASHLIPCRTFSLATCCCGRQKERKEERKKERKKLLNVLFPSNAFFMES
jgi:hypothetical protein